MQSLMYFLLEVIKIFLIKLIIFIGFIASGYFDSLLIASFMIGIIIKIYMILIIYVNLIAINGKDIKKS